MSFITDGVHLIQRIRDGRPVLVPGDGIGLWQAGNARNTGRMVARVVGQQKAIGKTYHCGHPELMRKDDYIKKIASVVGKDPVIVHVPTEEILATNHPDVMKSRLPVQTRYELAHSIQAFLDDYPDFRFQETVEEGIQAYMNYQEEKGNFANAGKEIIDDRLIAAWQECRKHFHL
jgi:nucleoside-diphosphate-sugar epimerase